MTNIFNKKKWSDIKDFSAYQKEIYQKHFDDNAIISLIKYDNWKEHTGTRLLNVPFSIKDNFATVGERTTVGARILSNYHPNFSSTVFKKLVAEGGLPLFSANLDALAMGGTGLSSMYGEVRNPIDPNHFRMTGGSSSGSAYQMASQDVAFSIGSDTGDSVRKRAAWMGVVGFKPSWGIVSRQGLADFAPTFDTVGWFTNTVEETAYLLDILADKDELDFSSVVTNEHTFHRHLITDKKYTLAVLKPLIDELKDPIVKQNWDRTIKALLENGHTIKYIEFDSNVLKATLPMYRTISSLEAFSCNSNLTGFLFGQAKGGDTFEEQIVNARTEGLPYEVKKRFMWGNYVLHYAPETYLKALKVRTYIINILDKIFTQADGIIMPSAPTIAPTKEEFFKGSDLLLEDYLVLFNANGSPSINVPINKEGEFPVGVNIATKPLDDLRCLQIAKIVEDVTK